MKVISFVIRTKNEENDIVETLKKLRSQKLKEYKLEIVLVDSKSTDNTVKLAQPFVDKVVNIEPEEFSWGKALNMGIEEACGDVIGLISGHCIMNDEYSIINSMEILEKNNIVCLYGKQIGDYYKDPFECIELDSLYPNKEYLEAPNDNIPFSNACCLLKRQYWESNKFDEVVQSAEDVLWATNMISNGHKIGYSNKLNVIHGHNLNIEYMYRKTFWKVYRTQLMLNKKNLLKNNLVSLFVINLILHPLIETRKYCKVFKEKKYSIKLKKIYNYMLIKYSAYYYAKRTFYYKSSNILKKYSEIEIPRWISNNKVIKEGV